MTDPMSSSRPSIAPYSPRLGRTRFSRAALVLVLAAAGMNVGMVAATAADTGPTADTCSPNLSSAQRADVTALRAADDQAAADIVDAHLRKLHDTGLKFDAAVTQLEHDLCLAPGKPVNPEPSQSGASSSDLDALPSTASTGNDVTVSSPRINLETATRRWYVIGAWDWLNQNYKNDGYTLGSRPQGGNDGFGITLGQAMAMTGASISVRGDCNYGWLTSRAPNSFNSHGAGWQLRDDVYYGPGLNKCKVNNYFDNQLAWGQQVITFRGPLDGKCHNAQAFSAFSHTWETTAVNGIGFGFDSVSFSWTKATERWNRASQPGNFIRVCFY